MTPDEIWDEDVPVGEQIDETMRRRQEAERITSFYEERDGVMVRISGPPVDLPTAAKEAWVRQHVAQEKALTERATTPLSQGAVTSGKYAKAESAAKSTVAQDTAARSVSASEKLRELDGALPAAPWFYEAGIPEGGDLRRRMGRDDSRRPRASRSPAFIGGRS